MTKDQDSEDNRDDKCVSDVSKSRERYGQVAGSSPFYPCGALKELDDAVTIQLRLAQGGDPRPREVFLVLRSLPAARFS